MDNVELSNILEKKGMDWLVAALIEGSIGYHTPKHAKILINRAIAGEVKDYCERCMACFNCDLMKMIERDVEIFERLEARDPQRSERIVSVAKQIASLDEEGQSLVSLAYPTMGV
ncbi:MAG: hypothetical protein Q7J35_01040 [Candidatus Methanoperedens sp.]|nr:hypothetical protein [Candidatus Methanoperedens sp.]